MFVTTFFILLLFPGMIVDKKNLLLKNRIPWNFSIYIEMTCVMKECETLVTSDILYSEHPVFLHSEYRSFFVPAIWHFIFRTSCIFTFRTSVIFCSGHPVFFIPHFRFLDYGHPDFIRQTGCRYGLLRPMSVKKRWDKKGLYRTPIG
jgi:hypothetical protein